MKPILLLDVDGVLSVPPKRLPVRPIRLPVEIHGEVFKLQFFPNARTSRFMRMAWKLFDVRWLTAWRSGANSIARHYGLPERREIRDLGSGPQGEWWKTHSVASALRSWKGRVAWIEDGVDETAKALIAKRGWTYFHCEPYVGVTGGHMLALRKFASGE